MNNVKFITAIYGNLYGTKFGGRYNRSGHYLWSLLSLLKITNAQFVCYTSPEEYDAICNFFYNEYNISKDHLEIKAYDLENHAFKELFDQYKDYEDAKKSDRCIELQWMKLIWMGMEDMSCDYYYWIDAGLSHCGLIPSKYLSLTGPHNRGYFESSLFNNKFLDNLITQTENNIVIIGKENQRNYWSGTVNPKHFTNYNNSIHIIGGLFGGPRDKVIKLIELFKKYCVQVTHEDCRLYHEEDILTLTYRNHEDLFKVFHFDTWWHEDERILGFDIIEHIKNNKSFYKIIEELNI